MWLRAQAFKPPTIISRTGDKQFVTILHITSLIQSDNNMSGIFFAHIIFSCLPPSHHNHHQPSSPSSSSSISRSRKVDLFPQKLFPKKSEEIGPRQQKEMEGAERRRTKIMAVHDVPFERVAYTYLLTKHYCQQHHQPRYHTYFTIKFFAIKFAVATR